MKKLTVILVIVAFIMSGCHRSGVPAATLLPSKESQWKPYNFIVKKTVDKYGAEKAQFAIQTEIVLSQSRDTSFLNIRGDVVDSIIYETRTIDAYKECLYANENKASNGSIIYKMEFKMKKTGEFIYLYFSGNANENNGLFTIKSDPDNPGKVKVAFGNSKSMPELWSANTTGQVLLYSPAGGDRKVEDEAVNNRIPGR